ncbi:MAG: ComF family protein, partial [Propionibacteriaceae bacterium]
LALALPLGASLALTVAQLAHSKGSHHIALLPAPSASATVRERGTDVMALVAKRARMFLRGAGIDCTVMTTARLVAAGADQGGLDRAARLRNLHGRMQVSQVGKARPVILVDDIVTTGATLNELSRASQVAGITVLGAATIAAAGWR